MVENGEVLACEEQHLLAAHVKKCFATEEIYTDDEQLEKYLGLQKYFPYELFEWEKFLLALHCCTYRKSDGMPRWPDLFCLIGRGAGKDGFIAFVAFCLLSEHNGIKYYDIDICANNEDQAMRPFEDVYEVLEDPSITKKLKKFFYWNKEMILSLKTRSKLKYRTNSPKGKDSLRSGAVIFNEIHQYENYDNINVFTTGLGKKKHPRRAFLTTDGDVRDGPLDHKKEQAKQILKGEISDNGLLPFIAKLNTKEDVHDPDNWVMANPSLPYLPNLQEEIEKEYGDWKINPGQFSAFMTKRMNIPDGNKEIEVTSWENILASCEEVPEEMLQGKTAVVGIDYAMVTDFASVGFLIRDGDKRYWKTHSWLCKNSGDLPRIKAPWREWVERGYLTLVDDVEISPDLLCDWILENSRDYHIVKLGIDNYRYALMANSLKRIGFDYKEMKNIKLVRPSDIMQVVPVIDSCFANQNFAWGDNPVMRWGTNNAKKIRSGKKQGTDVGNFVYGKIEAKSRKTDPFMALVAAMVVEPELGDGGSSSTPDVDVFTY
nr:terminase TerL endonuclease subunit [Anaerotalea alkaliphila]